MNQLYDINGVKVFEAPGGEEYVLADDYQDLRDEYKELEVKYIRVMDKIGDIWREG